MERLAPLMKYRRTRSMDQVLLNIKDLLNVKEYIEFGPENERLTIARYREKVERAVRRMVESEPVLQKLMMGEVPNEQEIRQLADSLGRQNPYVTEDILRKVYDNKKAKFIQFIKHILGLEEIGTFAETVAGAFDEFIARHNDFSNQQIRFLLTVKSFILQTGGIKKTDLVNPPFTRLHPSGIRGVFSGSQIDEIISLINEMVA
jgi:type I restriction enzyme R subunit